MAKKRRYLQKEVKTIEVYRKPTLQEAWDIVSEHLGNHCRASGNPSLFIDTTAVYEHHEHGKIYVHLANGTTLLSSTDKHTKGLGWW